MSRISQRTLTITGVTALVALVFALGYLLGNKTTPKATVDTPTSSLPQSMMRGSFSKMPAAAEQPKVAGLGGLVAGLEKKVAANPENIDQQLLLARTYEELGERTKGLKLLRSLQQQNANNPDVKFTLAALLMTGSDKQDLQEANQLFDEVSRQKAEFLSMARLHQGEIQVKLGNTPQAMKIWKGYLAKMPAGDDQRANFEERIAQNPTK
jgi:cytochrome c-type biogenesis protein CcmH